MARTKITAYVTPDVADTLKRLAAIDDRSLSDIVEDAIVRRLAGTSRDAEHAAMMARLDQVSRLLRRIEINQETDFEMAAQVARYTLSVAPEIPEADLPSREARGSERLRNILAIIVARLGAGRSLGRDLASRISPDPDPNFEPESGRDTGPAADDGAGIFTSVLEAAG
jgi:hypothetical protein